MTATSAKITSDLPGFYYDEEKQRYFKIESRTTAPPDAAWSSDNVKKRKFQVAQAQGKLRRDEEPGKHCITRSSLLAYRLAGGSLLREFGVLDRETPVCSWTAGLREKGVVSFWPGHENDPDAPNISCMLVEGGDGTGGVASAYATIDGHQVVGSYIPTDRDDNINFAIDDQMRVSSLASIRGEGIHLDEISSITYHKPSNTVLVTATNPRTTGDFRQTQACVFRPCLPSELEDTPGTQTLFEHDYAGRKPAWCLGFTAGHVSYTHTIRGLTMNSSCASPLPSGPDSPDILIGTSHGVQRLGRDSLSWVTPHPGRRGTHTNTTGPDQANSKLQIRDVLSVAHHPTNPSILYAGCRNTKLHRIDTRIRHRPGSLGGGDWYRHGSSVAHVRCLDDYQVLAAGPRNAMDIYDLRFSTTATDKNSSITSSSSTSTSTSTSRRRRGNWTQPVVRFPDYKNDAHIRIGLDVVGAVRGIVAAGQDDGTVALFSLRTGSRLRAGHVEDPARLKVAGGVVKALQLVHLPWERGTSLFVGLGPVVKKFSFGVDDDEEE